MLLQIALDVTLATLGEVPVEHRVRQHVVAFDVALVDPRGVAMVGDVRWSCARLVAGSRRLGDVSVRLARHLDLPFSLCIGWLVALCRHLRPRQAGRPVMPTTGPLSSGRRRRCHHGRGTGRIAYTPTTIGV